MPANSLSWSRRAIQLNCTFKMSTCLGLTHSSPGTSWRPWTSYSTLSLIGLKIYTNYLGVFLAHSEKAKEILAAVTIITLLVNAPALIYPKLITNNVFPFVVKCTHLLQEASFS